MTPSMRKDTLREVRKTFSRFLSLFLIVALGVGFFAGIRATGADMRLTADKYYRDTNLADMRLVSTLGFSDADVNAVAEIEGVADVMPTWYMDCIARAGQETDTETLLVRTQALPNLDPDAPEYMNQVTLVEGRMPQNPGECITDYMTVEKNPEFGIGAVITLEPGKADEDLEDTLDCVEYTVVGVARSSMHLDQTRRGTTNIGNGSLDSIIYLPADHFTADYYTELYITFIPAQDAAAYTEAYDQAVELLEEKLETLEPVRTPQRLEEVREEANETIEDAQAELDDGIREMDEKLADAQATIDDADRKLADGRVKLADGQKEYEDGLREFDEEIAKAQAELDDAKKELDEGWEQYREGREQFIEGEAQLARGKAQLEQAEAEYAAKKGGLDTLNNTLLALDFTPPATFIPESYLTSLVSTLNTSFVDSSGVSLVFGNMLITTVEVSPGVFVDGATENTRDTVVMAVGAYRQGIEDQLAAARAEYEGGLLMLAESRAELAAARQELERGREKYEDGVREFEEEKQKALDELEDGRQKILDAQQELADGARELEDGKREYAEKKAEAEAEVADAQKKLDDARQDLADLKVPEWYIQSRADFTTAYTNYGDESERIDNIAAIFPAFFLAVAALVCLTTMTRMVEEQRTQIGTAKALGYTSGAISVKYLVYTLTACLSGAAFGLVVCFKLFPAIIYTAYNMLYEMPPDVLAPFHWDVGIASTVVACLCAGGVTLAAVYSELRNPPAHSMRPKAPKAGKRVLLERITFLWKRLGFIQKVTMRNIFRYKKRVVMTVLGIAGCTALCLVGFGLSDAIDDITKNQYSYIVHYDTMVVYDDEAAPEEIRDIEQVAENLQGIDLWGHYYSQGVTAVGATGRNLDVNLSVLEQPELMPQFISLRTRIGGQEVPLTDSGAVITEKMSTLLELNIGDTVIIRDGDNKEYTVTITGITENYAMHYVYMTPAYYRQVFGQEPVYNSILLNLSNPADRDMVATAFMEEDAVLGISQSSDIKGRFSNMSENLGIVVTVLITAAGLLAFVVLFNLNNINITERTREIATLKVLGFYDQEVSSYIFRENILLTLLGDGVGLILGYYLTRFVVLTAEIDSIMFGRNIYLDSYLIAFGLTIMFSLIVNVAMYFKLRRISMVESMKSID